MLLHFERAVKNRRLPFPPPSAALPSSLPLGQRGAKVRGAPHLLPAAAPRTSLTKPPRRRLLLGQKGAKVRGAPHRLLGAAPRTSLAKPPRRRFQPGRKGAKVREALTTIHVGSESEARIHIPAKNVGGELRTSCSRQPSVPPSPSPRAVGCCLVKREHR